MSVMNESIKELINKEHLVYAATSSKDGVPNVSPKGSVSIIDDDTIVFAEMASPHTTNNLKENPNIAIYVLDKENRRGCQLKGKATLMNSGPIFEKISAALKEKMPQLPPANYAVLVKLEEAFPYGM